MIKEFIPYEQALALKELGFDEPCIAYYHNRVKWYFVKDVHRGDTTKNSEQILYPTDCAAPTFSQAFRWFREKYNFFSVVNVKYVNGASYFLRIETPPTNGYQYFDEGFKTYEEAELACLNKLIEIVKQK